MAKPNTPFLVYLNRNRKIIVKKMDKLDGGYVHTFTEDAFVLGCITAQQYNVHDPKDPDVRWSFIGRLTPKESFIFYSTYWVDEWIYEEDFRKSDTIFNVLY